MRFRLLDTDYHSGPWNMAVDEAVLKHVSEGKSLPTIRLYRWKPPAVTIGYFQSIELEVDIGYCKKRSYDIIRRLTGGGAVFHDKELTYSIIVKEDSKLVSENILRSYEQLCAGIVYALKRLGIRAEFVPINDIVAEVDDSKKKISGNAQTRRQGCILQHGTILLDVDVEEMFSILKVPDEKIKDKLIKNVKERVTSLSQVLGKELDEEKLKDALVKGFELELSIKTEPGILSDSEKKLAERYLSDQM